MFAKDFSSSSSIEAGASAQQQKKNGKSKKIDIKTFHRNCILIHENEFQSCRTEKSLKRNNKRWKMSFRGPGACLLRSFRCISCCAPSIQPFDISSSLKRVFIFLIMHVCFLPFIFASVLNITTGAEWKIREKNNQKIISQALRPVGMMEKGGAL